MEALNIPMGGQIWQILPDIGSQIDIPCPLNVIPCCKIEQSSSYPISIEPRVKGK